MYLINKFKILTYNIGFINKDIETVLTEGLVQGDIVWLRHKYKDRYFADPFLINEDDNYFYILCEEYPFWSEVGRIVLLKIGKKDYTLISRKLIISEPYHLSFPYCKIGSNWILPEASASGAAYMYHYDQKTQKVTKKRKVCDTGLIDNVWYCDDLGEYLYAGKTKIPSTELYLFKKGKEGLYKEERLLQSDNRKSRGAGDFFRVKDNLYRPVQDCKGRYGRQTKIMQVEHIGKDGYSATEVVTINSFENPPYNETLHTFNVYDDIIIVDGSRDFIRFPMKIFYRKCKWLFTKRYENNRNLKM